MAKVSTARKAAAKPRKSATRKRPGAAARGGRIDLETLHKKLANPRTSEAELKKYFVIDEDRSGPFTPRLVLNDATVQVPPTPEGRARGEMAIASMNWWCRMRRTTLFNDQIAAGYKGPIIVSEGNSWFQFPIILDDVIDQLISKGYAVRSLDAAGDTLDNMIETGEYLDALTQTGASVFLFSAGGNDILGGGNLVALLRNFDPTLTPAEHILPGFRSCSTRPSPATTRYCAGSRRFPAISSSYATATTSRCRTRASGSGSPWRSGGSRTRRSRARSPAK